MWFSGRGYCLSLNSFSSKILLIQLLSKTCCKVFFYERWWDGIWKTALCVSLGRHMHKCMNTVGQELRKHDVNKDSGLANPVQLLFTLSSSSALRLVFQSNRSQMENLRCNHFHWDCVRWYSISAFAPPKQGNFTTIR